MAVTAHAYDNAAKHLTNADVSFSADTIKAILLASYTYAQSHDTLADVLGAGTEASTTGTGYTARGATLASKTITQATHVTTLDAADLSWTTTTGTLSAVGVVFYKDTGTNSTSYVLAYEDFGGTQTASGGGSLSVTVPGVLAITAS